MAQRRASPGGLRAGRRHRQAAADGRRPGVGRTGLTSHRQARQGALGYIRRAGGRLGGTLPGRPPSRGLPPGRAGPTLVRHPPGGARGRARAAPPPEARQSGGPGYMFLPRAGVTGMNISLRRGRSPATPGPLGPEERDSGSLGDRSASAGFPAGMPTAPFACGDRPTQARRRLRLWPGIGRVIRRYGGAGVVAGFHHTLVTPWLFSRSRCSRSA